MKGIHQFWASRSLRDLTAHRCLCYRLGADGPVYRGEFEKRGKPVTVSVSGPLIVNDVEFMIRAAVTPARIDPPRTNGGCWSVFGPSRHPVGRDRPPPLTAAPPRSFPYAVRTLSSREESGNHASGNGETKRSH